MLIIVLHEVGVCARFWIVDGVGIAYMFCDSRLATDSALRGYPKDSSFIQSWRQYWGTERVEETTVLY